MSKEMESGEKNLPFEGVSESIQGGRFSKLRELQNNPDLLIKEIDPDEVRKYFGDSIDLGEEIELTKSYLKQLEGVEFVPQTSLVIGTNEQGEKTFFFVMKKVSGETLGVDEALSGQDKAIIEECARKIISIFITTYNNGLGCSVEFDKPSNYIKDENGKIFLVDLYPVFNKDVFEFRESVNNFCYQFDIPIGHFDIELAALKALS